MSEVNLKLLQCDGLHAERVYSQVESWAAREIDGWCTAFSSDICPQCAVMNFLVGVAEIMNGGKKVFYWDVIPEGCTVSRLTESDYVVLIPLRGAWSR